MSSGKNITSDKVIEFLDSYYKPLNKKLSDLRKRCESDDIPLILRETESFLRAYLSVLKPARILEIGTAYGYSAALFASILQDCEVVTIERDHDKSTVAVKAFEDMDLNGSIRLIEGDASEVLDLLPVDESFDFVFIDAGKSHYREYFDKCEKIMSRNAVCICDNILMNASVADSTYDANRRHRTSIKRMHDFLDYVSCREDLDTELLSCGDGIAVIRRK